MFEAAEAGRKLGKAAYKEIEPEIHHQLLGLQQQLRASKKSLIIIVSGVEGAGKGEVVDALNRWFDTRDVQTHAFFDESDEERERPRFWRFWRTLPARGTVSVLFGSWYTQPIVDHVYGKTTGSEFDQALQRIAEHEITLSRDGCMIVKLWFHLSKDAQQKRLKKDISIAKFKKSPLLDKYAKSYDRFAKVSAHAIRETDTGAAPWHIIEATDTRYRDIETGRILIAALEERLALEVDAVAEEAAQRAIVSLGDPAAEKTVLHSVDLSQMLDDKTYDKRISALQKKLHDLAWTMHNQKKNAVMVFEGWDAGGKGSSIRRITAAVDARLYRVIPVAAPTDEELAHHYLWRFWRHLPRAGYMTMYDRSWYGRVLVERVEGFADHHEWLRSYQEINQFEGHLIEHGTAVMKFWMHISAEEQLARFEARKLDARKQHKITEEDWRNRERWDAYELAVNDMVAHTSTTHAPWTLVAGNDKKFARVQILETICKRLGSMVKK